VGLLERRGELLPPVGDTLLQLLQAALQGVNLLPAAVHEARQGVALSIEVPLQRGVHRPVGHVANDFPGDTLALQHPTKVALPRQPLLAELNRHVKDGLAGPRQRREGVAPPPPTQPLRILVLQVT